MNWLKENWWKLCLGGMIVIIALVLWYLYTNKNIGINKEYLLRKSIKQYSDLIDVGLYDQALNEFLTSTAKAKIEVRDVSEPDPICQNKCSEDKTSVFHLSCIYACYKHTKIEVPASEIFKNYAGKRKNNWQDYQINKIVFSGNKRADVQFVYKENGETRNAPETWYYQNGRWLRDF